MVIGHVGEIWRYPVSSLGGEPMDEAWVEGAGIAGDRVWGLAEAGSDTAVGPDREKRWRVVPEMRSRLSEGVPEIDAGDGRWLRVDLDEARRAASGFLGHTVGFGPHAGSGHDVQVVAPRYGRANLHVLTTASMRHLAALLPAHVKVDARRFRPNIVIDMAGDGFVEQGWIGRELRFGEVLVRVSEACARCSFTAIAQKDLGFAPEVLHAITRHGGGDMGVYAEVVQAGPVRLSDPASLI